MSKTLAKWLLCVHHLASLLRADATSNSLSTTDTRGLNGAPIPFINHNLTAHQPLLVTAETDPIVQLSNVPNATTDTTPPEFWRSSLPKPLQNRTTLHKFHFLAPIEPNSGALSRAPPAILATVYLLGTSHISKSSCEDVQQLITHLRPNVLFLELCPQRLSLLMHPLLPKPNENEKEPGLMESVRLIQESNAGMSKVSALSAALLSKIQGDYATKFNATVGGEFRQAYKTVVDYNRNVEWDNSFGLARRGNGGMRSELCRVIVGDRPVRLTLIRAWKSLNLWGKFKLVISLLWSSIWPTSEKEIREWMDSILSGKDGEDMLTKSIASLNRHFPGIGSVIIHERDAYMFCKLQQTALAFFRPEERNGNEPGTHDRPPKTIVAVVGAGHCPGIRDLADKSSAAMVKGDYSFAQLDREIQTTLRSLIETKTMKKASDVDDTPMTDEMRTLMTDVMELQT